jgi:hypothetical protein
MWYLESIVVIILLMIVGVDCNVSPILLMKEKKVKKIIFEKSHIA